MRRYSRRSKAVNMTQNSTHTNNAMMANINDTNVPQVAKNSNSSLNYNALLPNFGGKEGENLSYFFVQFQQIAELAGWPKNSWHIILKSKLHGDALRLLASDAIMQQETDFSKLKLMLSKFYIKSKSLLQEQNEFHSITQSPEMTVSQLAQNIRSAAQSYLLNNVVNQDQNNELIDKLMLARFSEALRIDLRWELRKCNPQTFQDAVDKSILLEDAYEHKSQLINCIESNTTKLENEELKNEKFETQNKLQQLQAEINAIKIEKEKPIKCMACGKLGHFLAECWVYLDFKKSSSKNNYHAQNLDTSKYHPQPKANNADTSNQHAHNERHTWSDRRQRVIRGSNYARPRYDSENTEMRNTGGYNFKEKQGNYRDNSQTFRRPYRNFSSRNNYRNRPYPSTRFQGND